MAYLAFLYFCGLTLDLKPREVINPIPDISNFPFDYEDVIFILSRMSNFEDMSKVIYLSLTLIHLCFLTLRRKPFFMFTAENNFSSPVNMKNGGCRNVRKHKEIKGSDKYVTLDISSKFDNLDKMK